MTEPICPTCGLVRALSPYRPDHEGPAGPCYLCRVHPTADASIQAARVSAIRDLGTATARYLGIAGVPPRLRTATWAEVIPEVRQAIPPEIASAFAHGHISELGFGLIGDSGPGKSGGIAALCNRHIKATMAARLPRWFGDGELFPPGRLAWSYWPEDYPKIHMGALADGTQERIERLKNAAVLVLDDLGAEQFPSYHEIRRGFGHNALFQVIAHRNGSRLPVFWTSNAPVDRLSQLYGEAIFSRLVEDALPVQIAPAPNRRFV